jgi:hypothetical protein
VKTGSSNFENCEGCSWPGPYTKNNPEMYQLLKKYGNSKQAEKWAEELEKNHHGENFADHNPCTLVYALVKALTNLD